MIGLGIAFLVLGLAALISSTDFIAKTTSSITHSFGIPEYLASTIVISFVLVVPIFLIMQLTNIFDVPVLGISTVIGFSITLLTLVMGFFLIKNELPVEYEGYRNATFMWASALLLLIVSFDKVIDRMDAVFLLLLFTFYMVYIIYRTEKSKEYVYLKQLTFNTILYPISIVTVLICSWFIVYMLLSLTTELSLPFVKIGLVLFGFLFAVPMFDLINSTFRSSRLTFDNILGNIIVCLTLVPACAALLSPVPLTLGGDLTIMPFLLLNLIAPFFTLATRFSYSLHRKMGIALIVLYVIYVILTFII